jgi:hypothetical protein
MSYPQTKNEPKVHPLVKKSFVFVPSAGMRLAPEILVLEFMREIFPERHYGTPAGNHPLDPRAIDDEKRSQYTEPQRVVLNALRGRRKKTKTAKTMSFYAPAYPHLSDKGWLGKKRERVINNFLLYGPIAQNLWHKSYSASEGKEKQLKLSKLVIDALRGNNTIHNKQADNIDILAAALGEYSDVDVEIATANFMAKTSSDDESAARNSVIKGIDDNLANRITADLIFICELEPRVPRLQWLQLLMTFLRFSMPMWLLAQMEITDLLHKWIMLAIDNQEITDSEEIKMSISKRNQGLLHPTLTPTRELLERIEKYMKKRVELNILLYCIDEATGNSLKDKSLSLSESTRDSITIDSLLVMARDANQNLRKLERYKETSDGLSFKTFITREGEKFSNWRNPTMGGQGKNIDEFFRVLYRAEAGDEAGGYLFLQQGRGNSRGFRVFPGQLLLKAVTFLSAQGKWSSKSGGGKLVLQDVEDHFGQYGIDFSSAADARVFLMRDLQLMGLLTGSPDAGSSVAVACPF